MCKKPEFLKPAPPRILEPPRVPDPKKPDLIEAQPAPPRTRTSGFGSGRVLTRKTRSFIVAQYVRRHYAAYMSIWSLMEVLDIN